MKLGNNLSRRGATNFFAVREMLRGARMSRLTQFIEATVPKSIRMAQALNLPAARSKHGLPNEMRTLAVQNR